MPTLYTCDGAVSARRVSLFLAEKGITVPEQRVDLAEREQFASAFRQRNPHCTVPTLELDDGMCIGESDAICLYFETLHPDPELMGTDARSRALIRAWDRWVEIDGLMSVMEGFRNAARGFEKRAVAGPHAIEQIPALAERGRWRYSYFLDDLEAQLARSAYVARGAFSVADITAVATIDFARRVLAIEPSAYHTAINRWYDAVTARSAFATEGSAD
jgi:glutathione S-transferase